MGTSYALLGLVRHVPELLGATALAAFGQGAVRPTLTAQITQQAGRSEQGLVLGMAQSLTSIAQTLAPILSGVLIERRWLLAWALSAAVAGFAGLILNLRQPVSEPVAD